MSLDEARRKAAETVRSEIGTFVRLGAGEYNGDTNQFEFPLIIQSPKLIKDSLGREVRDVRFFSELGLGTLTVDGTTGEIERPNLNTMRAKIREQREEIDIAVQKALVSAAGRQLSHLPFPENQYSPLEDILAELLLRGDILEKDIELMDEGRNNERYSEYVDQLIKLDLAEREDGVITPGDILIGMEDEASTYQQAINMAIGRYFEHTLSDFDMIKRTLGPYLVIAGYYYRRALETEELPLVGESELRNAIKNERGYTGREKQEKLFKTSRYLTQLEGVGILHPVQREGKRLWSGDKSIQDRLREHSEYLGQYRPLMISG